MEAPQQGSGTDYPCAIKKRKARGKEENVKTQHRSRILRDKPGGKYVRDGRPHSLLRPKKNVIFIHENVSSRELRGRRSEVLSPGGTSDHPRGFFSLFFFGKIVTTKTGRAGDERARVRPESFRPELVLRFDDESRVFLTTCEDTQTRAAVPDHANLRHG